MRQTIRWKPLIFTLHLLSCVCLWIAIRLSILKYSIFIECVLFFLSFSTFKISLWLMNFTKKNTYIHPTENNLNFISSLFKQKWGNFGIFDYKIINRSILFFRAYFNWIFNTVIVRNCLKNTIFLLYCVFCRVIHMQMSIRIEKKTTWCARNVNQATKVLIWMHIQMKPKQL